MGNVRGDDFGAVWPGGSGDHVVVESFEARSNELLHSRGKQLIST